MAEWSFDQSISEDTSPPFEDLVELRSAFEIIEEVGPRYDSGKQLQKLDDDLFDGLRLRAVTDGHMLNWTNGSVQAKEEILKKIPVGSHSALEVVIGFNALKAACADLPLTHDSPVLFSKEHRIEQGLVFVRSKPSNKYVTGKPTSHHYTQISRDWAQFFIQLDALDSIVTNLTLRCLREGRAICLTQEASGWALQVPSHWEAKSGLEGHRKSRFLLTVDLPETRRFKDMGAYERSDRKVKAEALRWLYAQYRLPERPRDLLTKDTVLNKLETTFQMKTPKVRREIWEEAPISNWRSSGRRKNFN
jgi:hypothetical protein